MSNALVIPASRMVVSREALAAALAERPLVLPGFGVIERVRDELIAMAGFSTYLARALLNHVFRSTKYTAPGTIYFALNASDPTDAGTNTELPIGTGAYARVAVSVSDANWTTPATVGATEQIVNAGNVQFPTPSANWNSGNPITWASAWDAATAGNMLASGALGTPRTVLVTDNAPVFGPGTLVFSLA